MKIGSSPTSRKLFGVTFRDGFLTGWARGQLDAEQAEGEAQMLRLSLKLREDRLGGSVTVLSRSAEGLPGALSHWMNLERPAATAP